MRLRISLRGVLIVTALLAVLCYWLARPQMIAAAFVAAVESKDQEAVLRLISNSQQCEFVFESFSNAYTEARAARQQQRVDEWLQGKCGVTFVIEAPGNLMDFHGTGVASSMSVEIQTVHVSGGLKLR